jgi:uncharacterized protein YbjT (DUF2867 family)
MKILLIGGTGLISTSITRFLLKALSKRGRAAIGSAALMVAFLA